jgi:hypothetical protein
VPTAIAPELQRGRDVVGASRMERQLSVAWVDARGTAARQGLLGEKVEPTESAISTEGQFNSERQMPDFGPG